MKAELNFVASSGEPAIWDPQTTDKRFNLVPAVVDIADVREMAKSPSLDVEGFILANIPLERRVDETDLDFARRHNDEVRRQIPEILAASSVYAGNPQIHLSEPLVRYKQPPSETAMGTGDYVHNDFRGTGTRRLFEIMFPDMKTELDHPDLRIKVVQTWVALSPPPQDAPLAIVDLSSLADEDVIPGSVVVGGQPGGPQRYEHELFLLRHNVEQKWYYVSNMRANDVLIWVGYDEGHPERTGCPHSSVLNSTIGLNANPRVSYDTKGFLLYR